MVSGSRPDRRQAGATSTGRRGCDALHGRRDRLDVLGRRAAAAAEDVDQAALGELLDDGCGLVRRLVVLAKSVGQPRIRVARDVAVGEPGELGEIGPHLRGAERAVEADQQRAGVPDRVPERLGDLAGQGATGGVGDGPGDGDRPAPAALLEQRLEGEDRGLGVERVEDRLDEQQVRAAVDQAVGLLEIGVDQLDEGDVAGARVVDVRGDRGRAVGRTRGRRRRSAGGSGRPRSSRRTGPGPGAPTRS